MAAIIAGIVFVLLGSALIFALVLILWADVMNMMWAGVMDVKTVARMLMTYWYLPVGATLCFVIAGWLFST